MTPWIRTTLAAGLLLVTTVASAAAGTEGPAKLTDAQWNPEAGVPEGSEVTDDEHVLTTTIPAPPTDLVAHATLIFDVSRGRNGLLSFLSTHSWVKCEAPEGLVVGDSGQVAVVCRAEAKKLARLKKKTRVYIKADPPGGGRHKKLYWVLLPPAG